MGFLICCVLLLPAYQFAFPYQYFLCNLMFLMILYSIVDLILLLRLSFTSL